MAEQPIPQSEPEGTLPKVVGGIFGLLTTILGNSPWPIAVVLVLVVGVPQTIRFSRMPETDLAKSEPSVGVPGMLASFGLPWWALVLSVCFNIVLVALVLILRVRRERADELDGDTEAENVGKAASHEGVSRLSSDDLTANVAVVQGEKAAAELAQKMHAEGKDPRANLKSARRKKGRRRG